MTARYKPSFGVLPWFAIACLSAVVFGIAHRHAFLSAYVINDDVRQQIFWMARWLDPRLYPQDLLSTYANVYVPPGVKALYYLAAKGFGCDPILFSKLLSGLLFVVLAVALCGIGLALEGPTLGLACAAMVWLMPFFLKNISGGLSRSFAAPMLALFVWAWIRRRGVAMGLVLLLEALCIPYMALLCAGCSCLEATVSWARRRQGPAFPAKWWHIAVLALAGWLVWRMNHAVTVAGFGPLVTGSALLDPVFSAAGRLELFPLPNPFFDLVYWPFESIGLFLDIGLFTGIASLAVLLPFLIRGARRAPWKALAPSLRPLAFLLAGSLLLYTAARIVALALFVPDRYISYSLNLLYALGLAVCLRWALAPAVCSRRRAAVLLGIAALVGVWRLSDAGLYDYSKDAPLYHAVAQLPYNALIAGNPEVLDTVLTFGRRNVLASFELAHPWSRGYWQRYRYRLAAQANAYYAKDIAQVIAMVRRWGVTHIVVRESDFTPEAMARHPLFEPYDTQIAMLGRQPGDFVLLDAALFPYQRVAPGIRLIDVRGLIDPTPSSAAP